MMKTCMHIIAEDSNQSYSYNNILYNYHNYGARDSNESDLDSTSKSGMPWPSPACG